MKLQRTHNAGLLRKENVGETVVLNGWIQKRRDLGGVIFADLRDKSGIVQLVFPPGSPAFETAETLRSEFVIGVKGVVQMRPEVSTNKDLATREIEVEGSDLVIFSKAETPPFPLDDKSYVDENIRMKYRYLDLRRPSIREKLMLRSRIMMEMRKFYESQGFTEVETPILSKSTPEGARDYLVPSRLNPGSFFALPQSPQIYKQLLMVGGMEKYFQIARCFRDEDLRADRQPEFTQLDVEMSFVDAEDIQAMHEKLMQTLFKNVLDIDLPIPFARMSYAEAMDRYGSDKPDTRFGMLLHDLSDIVKGVDFVVFKSAIENGGVVKAINVKGQGTMPRKELDRLQETAKTFGAKGLAWMVKKEGEVKSPILKFLNEEVLAGIMAEMEMEEGDLILFAADTKQVANTVLGGMRQKLAAEKGMIDESLWNFLWITDFPLLEFDEEENRYVAVHHPFTMPMEEDIPLLDTDPGNVRAKAYDMVLNGYELGGGSIRIHDSALQKKMFQVIGLDDATAEDRFGFMLEAFRYGTPPHGGIAFGLDRVAMLLGGTDNIRDVIAFPKNQKAMDLMMEAPNTVEPKQLDELFIACVPVAEKE